LALRLISDHVVPTWDSGRQPTASEVRATLVLRVPLAEISGKVRTGGPSDEPGDLDGPHRAGLVPIESSFGAPIDAPDLARPVEPPPAVVALRRAPTPTGSSRRRSAGPGA
jgi:uncharacterized protein